LRRVSAAIIAGDGTGREAVQICLDAGIPVDEILFRGVISAWEEFCEWYARDPMGALKKWLDCFNTTYGALRTLESRLPPAGAFAPAILVCTARGENHVLMRDIISVLLKARGLRVYSYRKGLTMDEAYEAMVDRTLQYVVISCIQDDAIKSARDLIEGIRARRPDVKIIAGGPNADQIYPDAVARDIESLIAIINHG